MVAGSAAFLLLGAVVALYGPLFPQLRTVFDVGIDEVGAVVSAHFLGSFVTVITSGVLLRRLGYRTVLLAGSGVLVVGLGVMAVAPSWPVFVLGAGLLGLGFGAVQVAANLLVARTFEVEPTNASGAGTPNASGAASALNMVNAVFGLGALTVPLLVVLFAPGFVWPLLILALLALVVFVLLARLPRYPQPPTRLSGADGRGGTAVIVGFVLLYLFYVSAEVGVTSWATEHLTPLVGASIGAAATSLYWGALTVGRLLAVFVARRTAPRRLLISGLSIGFVGLLLANIDSIAPFAYGLVGLAMAPTFATGLAWLTAQLPRRAEQVTPLVLAAASLGPVATAPLIGVIIAGQGAGAVPFTLATFVGLALLSALFLARLRPLGPSGQTTAPAARR